MSVAELLPTLQTLSHTEQRQVMQFLTTLLTPPERPNGWPPGFFEQTYGSTQDDPLERPPQGEFELRQWND
jgi:hypothetical protein